LALVITWKNLCGVPEFPPKLIVTIIYSPALMFAIYKHLSFLVCTIHMYSIIKLTRKQTEVMKYIANFKEINGSSPTYREIASNFGFKSPKAASDHVCALERKGYIRRHNGRSRGIDLIHSNKTLIDSVLSVPLLGSIKAGYPEEHKEDFVDTLAIDKAILGVSQGNRLFALRVSGNSMEQRGIFEGDWAIADADSHPQKGDIVVALIDGENTLKILTKQKGRFYLKAANPTYADLIPSEELIIQVVVRTFIRRLS